MILLKHGLYRELRSPPSLFFCHIGLFNPLLNSFSPNYTPHSFFLPPFLKLLFQSMWRPCGGTSGICAICATCCHTTARCYWCQSPHLCPQKNGSGLECHGRWETVAGKWWQMGRTCRAVLIRFIAVVLVHIDSPPQ